MLNAPIFTSVIFSVIMLMLPNYDPALYNISLILVIVLGFFLPFAFSNKLISSASLFFENIHPFGKKFLSVHGIVFLLIFQVFALLCSVDYLFSQFFGEVHTILMIGMIVLAGLFSVAGGARLIRTINILTSTLLMVGLLVLLVNNIFFHIPIFDFYNPLYFQQFNNSNFVNVFGSNIIVSVVSLCIIIFWLMWLEQSELIRKKATRNNSLFIRSIIISGIFLTGVFILFSKEIAPVVFSMTNDSNLINFLIMACSLGGLFGLFVTTFSSIGNLFAQTIYPQFNPTVDLEKQSLVNKLTTVFSIIVAILLISVVRNIGGTVIMWYIYFLAACSSPIVVSFLIAMLKKNINSFALSLSIILGEAFGLIELLSLLSVGHTIFINAVNIFSITIGGTFVTAVSYFVISKTSEMIIIQKLLAKTKQ